MTTETKIDDISEPYAVKYYKDSNGLIYSYAADGSHDEIIPDNLILIESEEEVVELMQLNPLKEVSAVDKLKNFLNSNPDIADLLK